MSGEFRAKSWTRREYDHLIQIGFFHEDEPIELVHGRLIVAEAKSTHHTVAVPLAAEALRRAFDAGWSIRIQDPIAADEQSEPEPDVAVVAGRARDFLTAHPSRPALVVEVAESSLAFDRRHKGELYAGAGIADYWIVNLVDRVLEVYRDPMGAAAAHERPRYRDVRALGSEATVSPLAAPGATIGVGELLP